MRTTVVNYVNPVFSGPGWYTDLFLVFTSGAKDLLHQNEECPPNFTF